MSVLKAEAKNFKVHSDIAIELNGRSAFLVGDSEVGKTSFMEIIQAHLNQVPYPANPLKDGEDEGYTKTTHDFNGKVYTITRKYKRMPDGKVKLDRFKVTDPVGGSGSPESMLSNILGAAFGNAKFDYNEYFIKALSREARMKYFIKAIGGDAIEENHKKISELEKERGPIGTARETQQAIWEQGSSFSIDTVDKDIAYYSQDMEIEDADKVKQAVLATLKPVDDLKKQLEDDSDLAVQLGLADSLLQDARDEIQKLEEELARKKAALVKDENDYAVMEKNKLTKKQVDSLQAKIKKAETENAKIKEKAQVAYSEKLDEIVTFKSAKESFFNTIKSFKEWKRLDTEWKELDQKIKDLRTNNEEILKSRIPLPEITIGEIDGNPAVLYKGREFKYDNFSTGQRIKITAQIQRVLNPTGDNFIVVENGWSLGSKLNEVVEECKKFGVQFLIELTKPNEEFGIEFVDADEAKSASLTEKETK